MKLYEELCVYMPYNLQGEANYKIMMRHIKEFPSVYTRDNVYGHITSNSWVINTGASKVLMIYHNIYNSWGWYGGHADGDRDLIHITLGEGRGETELKRLELLSESVLAIDMLPVSPHAKRGAFVSSHVRSNITYLCQADKRDTLCNKPDENSGARWIAMEEIDHYVAEEDMRPIY